MSGLLRIVGCCTVLLGAGLVRAATTTTTTTTTTTYEYNADGAPTAVTTQVDDQPATTLYLTWDNFTPSATAPATGTVSAGDGNLIGLGGTPGVTAQFAYDARDRLTACDPPGAAAATYAYSPVSLMASSTLDSGDALQFYYDDATHPSVVNSRQLSTGAAASFLGNVRYLSDGSEQVMLRPRKDTVSLYDASTQALAPYAYEPYGAPLAGTTSPSSGDVTTYDLAQNPFLYAGEYLDPTCDAYYLRARWYLAAQQTFLSRDRGDPLRRYSYAAGNPIGRVDPSGLHGAEAGAAGFLKSLDATDNGARGIASRFFLGSLLGIAQIIANPSGYWHELEHDTDGIDIFLAAGIALEVGTSGWFGLPDLPGSAGASFAGRHLFDAVLGAGQSIASGMRHGRMDWASVGQGIEYTAGGMFMGRELAGVGYKPFGLAADDVAQQAMSHLATGGTPTEILVYRVREPLVRVGRFRARPFTSPVLELGHLGIYHETLVGVLMQYDEDAHDIALRHYEVSAEPLRIESESRWTHRRLVTNGTGVGLRPSSSAAFVGVYRGGDSDFRAALFRQNGDNDFVTRDDLIKSRAANERYPADPYRLFGNNCQNFAARIRQNLGVQ